MAGRLILWSDKPNEWSFRSSKSEAKGLGGNEDTVEEIQGLRGLVTILQKQQEQKKQFWGMILLSHGSAGTIALSGEEVPAEELRKAFRSKGFDKLFIQGSNIVLRGCEVAAGHSGERFLCAIGELLLCNGGGRVQGHTASNFTVPVIGLLDPIFLPGDWITATVGPGGTVKLVNPQHLDLKLINERFASAERSMAEWERLGIDPIKLKPARTQLWAVKRFLDSSKAGTYETMYESCISLSEAERIIKREDPRGSLPGPRLRIDDR